MLGRSKTTTRTKEQQASQRADWRTGFRKRHIGVDDLTLISRVSNDDIMRNLEARFGAGEIYTYIGHVLISVNPFRELGLYTDAVLHSYLDKSRIEMPPHLFSVAEAAATNLLNTGMDQCVIVSGESGAGKTEATKKIMHYLTVKASGQQAGGMTSKRVDDIKTRVMSSNPLLESFGNAKTTRNNNSSRFGKYLELLFVGNEPAGAVITNFLLEKGRVVSHARGERNYHIFYQLCRGADDSLRRDFSLYGPENYFYTSQGNTASAGDTDDADEFQQTLAAMEAMGLTHEEQYEIFRLLSAILWMGNVAFQDNTSGSGCRVVDQDVMEMVAYLLGVDSASINTALTSRSMETSKGGSRGTMYAIPLNSVQATAARDSLAKFLYDGLFNWLIRRVNSCLKLSTECDVQRIGILDVYGFETFEKNSFEQLCINYVNEKLQQIFVQLTLKQEQEEYVREDIAWSPIDYFNNKIVCDLIEEKSRPPGVFSIMNDVVATAHADIDGADRSLAQRLGSCSAHPHFTLRADSFCIRHYAGDVTYDIRGMAEKNKDQLAADLAVLISTSQFPFIQTIVSDPAAASSTKKPQTASDRIKQSAGVLVETLMKTQPSYVRCIKPNENKSASEFDQQRVLHQVKYLGLLENVRVRRAGFCHRQPYQLFMDRFYLLSRRTGYAGAMTWPRNADIRQGCQHILADASIYRDEWQLGRTKVFIRHPETLWALEHLRTRYWHNMAARIQRSYRAHVRRRWQSVVIIQRAYRHWRSVRDFLRLRDYGHEMYSERKQRRRFSLLSMRRFCGDYLNVQECRRRRSLCSINDSATVILFSSRCSVLVQRGFLRSPKLTPAEVVLTSSCLYLLGIQPNSTKESLLSLTSETPVQLLRKLSFSPYADNIMILHVDPSSTEHADIIIDCPFKTELCVHLQRIFSGYLEIQVEAVLKAAPKNKIVTVKFDHETELAAEAVRQDGLSFKVGPGMPANSISRPQLPRSNSPFQPRSTSAVRHKKTAVRKVVAKKCPPPPPPSRQLYTAMFSYVAQQKDELGFALGDRAECLENDHASGWFKARIISSSGEGAKVGATGWVPANYFEAVADNVQQQTAPVQPVIHNDSKPQRQPPEPKYQPQLDLNSAGNNVKQLPPVPVEKLPQRNQEQNQRPVKIKSGNVTPPPVQNNCQHSTAMHRVLAMGGVATPMAMAGGALLSRKVVNTPPSPPQGASTAARKPAAMMPPPMPLGPKPTKSSRPSPPLPDCSPPPIPRSVSGAAKVPRATPFR